MTSRDWQGNVLRKVLLTAVFLSCAMLLHSQEKPCNGCSLLDRAMTAYEHLHAGMTRQDLEQNFRSDGGLSSPKTQVYVFRECTTIKLEATFEKPSDPSDYWKADNKVQSLGRLYIDHPVMD